jgi:hypothetical protein
MARIMKHGKCGDNLTWTINNEGLLTISGEGEMWDYDHPDENDNYWESWDEESWDKWQNLLVRNSHSPFENKNKIKSIKILYGSRSISDCAFCYCLNLTSVEIPNSIIEIKGSAFYYCRSLESMKIPNSVTIIGDYAFEGCSHLSNVEIPAGVKSIGYRAFYETPWQNTNTKDGFVIVNGILINWTYPKNLNIPKSVTAIGSYTFYGKKGVSVILPETLTSIQDHAFSCDLRLLTIPSGVTSIGDEAFAGCMEKIAERSRSSDSKTTSYDAKEFISSP